MNRLETWTIVILLATALAVFDLIRSHRSNAIAILCAFDLHEVNGEYVRREEG